MGLATPSLIVLAAVVLAGCADRRESAAVIATAGGLSFASVAAGDFSLATYRRLARPDLPVRIYIEGDGSAWLGRTRLSSDPTPRDPVALRLAAADAGANVAWIARPCQYGGTTTDAACRPALWSHERMSEAAVAAVGRAVDALLPPGYGAGIELVGFSGGGGIAALLAARRPDVRSLRTVAGNLDHAAFTALHAVSPLAGSLNPADVASALAGLPQIHFLGNEDTVIPAAVAESYAARAGAPPCLAIRRVAGADHHRPWPERWPELLAQPLPC